MSYSFIEQNEVAFWGEHYIIAKWLVILSIIPEK